MITHLRRCGAAVALATGVVVAVGAGGSGVARAVVAPGATPSPVTPILSVRRLPDWIEQGVADQRLAARLPAVLAPLGAARRTSCLVVTRGSDPIYDANATREELPASNLKVLTATAVLDELGPETRLATDVTETGRRVGATLHGHLSLVGGGDPFLWTPGYAATQVPPEPLYTSLPSLAARVRASGIRRVDGGVVGDEHLFDGRRGVPSWKSSYEADGDVGPLSALEVDNGFRTGPPYGAAPQPAVMAAGVFADLLRADGVRVVGRSSAGTSPPTARVLASVTSAPLGRVVAAVLRVSDDTGAELLTKLLGRRFGAGGTTTAGTTVVRADLARDGLPVAQLRAVDGSGLSRDDRVSCALMADDLRRVGAVGPIFDGLPVAGRSGTLASRFLGTPAAGRLHAKTGTLDGVSALSGFVVPAAALRPQTPLLGQPVVFSFIANGLTDGDVGVQVGDALGVALATPPAVPPLTAAEPVVPGTRPAGPTGQDRVGEP